ncbi:heparinase II/III-family protein [Salipaludibacillus sp. CUR1]|uniref:heparinase II/III family protein n=1 Tax=Salipaludibacillus sp. CUR1 TaxID=2820003 RepID=UPI001E5CF249|nr:heparinase II/III-family protein [Salipaludibacillus sp. CUR1]MCE7791778.1 heparinase II/III-family protein [Salipaludibacillus sp. CUR1]
MLASKDILNMHSTINDEEQLEKIYEDYKAGIYRVSARYSSVALSDSNLWNADVHDRSWLFWHHCLVSVAYLIDSYKVDGNPDKLQLAKEIVFKWHHGNSPESPSVMGWHDHTTAIRLIQISKLYLNFNEAGDKQEESYMTEIAAEHMEKLSDESFYMPNHNHGLDQDIALYIGANVFRNAPRAEEWIKLARERFWKQLNNLFAEDGSYLEHSPHYIYIIAQRLLAFNHILIQAGDEEVEELGRKLEKIIRFFIYMLQPDGKFQTIGDSEAQTFNINKHYWGSISDNLLRILNSIKGKNNEEIDLPNDAFFSDGGYAIYRSDWNNDEETSQLTFYSAFNSRVHKHHDDLAFTFYSQGMPLLTDAGKFSYQYDKEERQYVTSAFGHNTVRINNEETELRRKYIGLSDITSFLSLKNIGYASGFHALSKNAVHRRVIFYLKPTDILILDIIKGGMENTGELIYNLHPKLKTRKINKEMVSAYEDNDMLYISNVLDEAEFDHFRGQQNPVRGWSSFYYQEWEPSDLLTQQKTGEVVTFATHIRTNKTTNLSDFQWNGNHITFKWKNYDIDLLLTDWFEHIHINEKYFNTQKKFSNNKLFEALVNNDSLIYKEMSKR